jgi:hypothetical protein
MNIRWSLYKTYDPLVNAMSTDHASNFRYHEDSIFLLQERTPNFSSDGDMISTDHWLLQGQEHGSVAVEFGRISFQRDWSKVGQTQRKPVPWNQFRNLETITS